MELAFFIYLAETICTKSGESGYAAIIGMLFLLSMIGIVVGKVDPGAIGDLNKVPLKPTFYISSLLLVLYMLTPSQKTAYTMLGAYGIQTFATAVYKNDQAKRIATNSLNLVEDAISKYEKEMSK
jgi:hypothetical protein